MKTLNVVPTFCLSLFSFAGCATTMDTSVQSDPSRIAAEDPRASTFVHESRTVRLASESLLCMSGRSEDSACATVAMQGCVTVDSLMNGQPAAIEQIEERLDDIARGEGLNNETRAAVMHWFDTAASAVREARIARAGARCARAEACRVRADGNPAVDDLENAWRGDVRAVQRHAAFDQLVACSVDAEELEPEIRASTLAVFAMRLEIAANARPEVRDEALHALALLEASMDGASGGDAAEATVAATTASGPPSSDEASAHEPVDARTLVVHARATLHRHLETATVRGGARVLFDVARSIDTTVADARAASANPCGSGGGV